MNRHQRAALAHHCLAQLEAALDTAGWPYLPGLSRVLDALRIVLEDAGDA